MASWAHLALAPDCPSCARPLAVPYDLIAFQWGYCPSRVPIDAMFYALGDELVWRLDDSGAIPPWTYFDDGLCGGNLGDPALGDVLVRGFGLGGTDLGCRACGAAGLSVCIEAGRITRLAPAIAAAELAVVDGGRILPRPDLDDAPMTIIHSTRRELTTASGRRAPLLSNI